MSTVDGTAAADGSVPAPQSTDGPTEKPSFSALLEVANDIRKKDSDLLGEQLPQTAMDGSVASADDPFVDASNKESHPTVTAPAAHTNNNSGSSTYYSADTVAAISSLINQDSPLFANSSPSDPSSSSTTLAITTTRKTSNYELSLEDRATALLTVYKDYLHETTEEDTGHGMHENSTDFTSQGPLMVREGEKLMLLPDNNGQARAGAAEGTNLDQPQLIAMGNTSTILTPQDLRKEEIKLATLEKFCGGGGSVGSGRSSSGGSEKKKRKKKKKHNMSDGHHHHTHRDGEDGGSSTRGSSTTWSEGDGIRRAASTTSSIASWDNIHKRKKASLSTGTPTAASTTAAFRLKAEVALRTLSSKTVTIAGKAANATKATAAKTAHVVKTKYRDSTTNVKDMEGEDITNDYDFQSYDHDNYCGDGGLAPPSTDRGVHSYDEEDMEYGIVSPLGDKGLVFRGEGDMDDGQSFTEICSDLGVTAASHPYLYPRKTRYRYPIFRSKKFRKAVCYGAALVLTGLVFVAIASAITNGFQEARRQKAPPLPDWKKEEDWREQQKLEWEEDHGGKYNSGSNAKPPDVTNEDGIEDAVPPPPISEKDEIFQSVSAAYRPVWFDRSTGWKGQTYEEAKEFCLSHSEYIPCPYEIYCPPTDGSGVGKKLLAGVMDSDGESWSAVINAPNEWVQVGTGGECDLYSSLYGQGPEWGLSGVNNEAISRHIMCCRSHPIQQGSEWNPPNEADSEGNDYVDKPLPSTDELREEAAIFKSVHETFNPRWFGRNSGWTGQTYQQGVDFCAERDSNIPCPVEGESFRCLHCIVQL